MKKIILSLIILSTLCASAYCGIVSAPPGTSTYVDSNGNSYNFYSIPMLVNHGSSYYFQNGDVYIAGNGAMLLFFREDNGNEFVIMYPPVGPCVTAHKLQS
jgi:hypothetical protein